VFTYTGTPPQQFCPGSTISIATALDGTNPLVGVIGNIDSLDATTTFTLYSGGANSVPLNAGATVSGVTVTYNPPAVAQVDKVVLYTGLSASWTSLASGAAIDVTITGFPAAAMFSTTARLYPTWPTSPPAGLLFMPFVSSTSAIKVRVVNVSGSASTSSISFTMGVSQ
jgi:hypothetical protein